MEKQEIYFNEREYNQDKLRLNSFVERVNRAIPIITEIEPVNEEMILNIINDPDYIKKTKYQERMQFYADQFQVPREIINFRDHEFLYKLANGAIQHLYKAKEVLERLYYNDFITDEFFMIENDIATVTPDADDKLRELHTYYAETERELEVFELYQEVIDNLNAIKEVVKRDHYIIEDVYQFGTTFSMADKPEFEMNIHNFKQIIK